MKPVLTVDIRDTDPLYREVTQMVERQQGRDVMDYQANKLTVTVGGITQDYHLVAVDQAFDMPTFLSPHDIHSQPMVDRHHLILHTKWAMTP